MNPSQKTLLRQAEELASKTSATPAMWKYNDPDTGKVFYLTEKVVTIRSPWTGKTFTARPEKSTISDVGNEIRDEKKK